MPDQKRIMFTAVRRVNYPWPELGVGDSVEISDQPMGSQGTAVSAAREWGNRRNPKIKFASRKTDNGGVRIWRLE